MTKARKSYLRLLDPAIGDVDGTRTLLATFGESLYLDCGCKHLGDYVSPCTPVRPVNTFIQEMHDGRAREIYNKLGVKLKLIAFTPAQVCDFCITRGKKLSSNTLFLIIAKGRFFIVQVCVCGDGSLEASVFKLSYGHVWLARSKNRFVIPQPDTSAP